MKLERVKAMICLDGDIFAPPLSFTFKVMPRRRSPVADEIIEGAKTGQGDDTKSEMLYRIGLIEVPPSLITSTFSTYSLVFLGEKLTCRLVTLLHPTFEGARYIDLVIPSSFTPATINT